MRIQIQKEIDGHTKELWSFNMHGTYLVFVYWQRQIKPKGKRKWSVEKFWNAQENGGRYGMEDEPFLPETIRSEAITELIKIIKVYTKDEWKNINKHK